jgi:hypothetical protein
VRLTTGREGDEALAASVHAHVREGGPVETVALEHGDIRILQRLDQLSGAVAPVAHDRSPGEQDGAALLLHRCRVEGLRFGGTDVEDFEGLRHECSRLEFKAGGCGWDVEPYHALPEGSRRSVGLACGS